MKNDHHLQPPGAFIPSILATFIFTKALAWSPWWCQSSGTGASVLQRFNAFSWNIANWVAWLRQFKLFRHGGNEKKTLNDESSCWLVQFSNKLQLFQSWRFLYLPALMWREHSNSMCALLCRWWETPETLCGTGAINHSWIQCKSEGVSPFAIQLFWRTTFFEFCLPTINRDITWLRMTGLSTY